MLLISDSTYIQVFTAENPTQGLGLPRGMTVVTGGNGLSELCCFGALVSFFGFLDILLLRCSPLAMTIPFENAEIRGKQYRTRLCTPLCMRSSAY